MLLQRRPEQNVWTKDLKQELNNWTLFLQSNFSMKLKSLQILCLIHETRTASFKAQCEEFKFIVVQNKTAKVMTVSKHTEAHRAHALSFFYRLLPQLKSYLDKTKQKQKQ